MIYLITGGAGFIGSNFIRRKMGLPISLTERKRAPDGDKIIVLDALTYAGNLDNLSGLLKDNILAPKEKGNLFYHDTADKNSKSIGDSFSTDMERMRLKTKGHSVKEIGRNRLGRTVERELEDRDIVFVIGNILDRRLLDVIVPIADHIVHFAAETHVDRSILDPATFLKTDVFGTYTLLESAKKHGMKPVLHVSTDEVYGSASKRPFRETDPINPRNPYSACKAAADRLVHSYQNTYGLPVKIVRPSNNFGPRQYPEKLMPVVILRALNNEPIPVYGDGRQVRDWLYVGDTARAIELVVKRGEEGGTYNIAGRNKVENIKIVEEILGILKKDISLIEFVKDRPGHDFIYWLDDTKIRKELGFDQERHFEEDLRATIDWYVQNEGWWKRILDGDEEYREFVRKWYSQRA